MRGLILLLLLGSCASGTAGAGSAIHHSSALGGEVAPLTAWTSGLEGGGGGLRIQSCKGGVERLTLRGGDASKGEMPAASHVFE